MWVLRRLVFFVHEQEFRKGEHQCTLTNMNMFKDKNLDMYFKRGYRSVSDDAIPMTVIREAGNTTALYNYDDTH